MPQSIADFSGGSLIRSAIFPGFGVLSTSYENVFGGGEDTAGQIVQFGGSTLAIKKLWAIFVCPTQRRVNITSNSLCNLLGNDHM